MSDVIHERTTYDPPIKHKCPMCKQAVTVGVLHDCPETVPESKEESEPELIQERRDG